MTPVPPAPGDDEQLWILLDRYLAGDARAHEAEAVRAWLAEDPAHADVLEDLRRIRDVAARRPPVRSADAVWGDFARELGVDAQPPVQGTAEAPDPHPLAQGAVRPPSRTSPRRSIRFFPQRQTRGGWLAAATAVLAVATGSYAVWQSGGASRPERAAGHVAPPRVFATARGQRAEIRLTDGTSVALAADSRLVVPADFDSTGRTVTLTGEAYFDVVHNDRKPFVVRARQAVVRDIGTRFDVRAYPADASVRLVVTQGRVRIRHVATADSSGQLIHAGHLAHLDSLGATSPAQRVDTTRYVAWTQGRLDFVDTPMRDVAVEIGRWYDVDIRFSNSALAGRRLTATIRDQPLTYVLDQLAVALDVRVARRGRTITLVPNPAPSASKPDRRAATPAGDDRPSAHS